MSNMELKEDRKEDIDDVMNTNTTVALNNKVLGKNTCNLVQKQNRQLLEIAQDSLKIADNLECLNNNDGAKNFAVCVQSGVIDLVKTRSDMRGTVQLIMEIQKYKPPTDGSTNAKCLQLWKDINASCKNIFKTTVDTMVMGAKYMAFLMKISNSLIHFKQMQTGKESSLPSIELSLAPLFKDMDSFLQFKNAYDKAVGESRNVALECLNKCVDSFLGEQAIQGAQEKLKDYEQEHLQCVAEWKKLELDRLKELMPKRQQAAKLQGELEALKVRIKYANGNAEDYKKAMQEAAEKAKSFADKAANATDYEVRTTYSYHYRPYYYRWYWGWYGGYSYSSSSTSRHYTGKQSNLKQLAKDQETQKKEQETKMISSQKEKEEAVKRQTDLEKELAPILEEIAKLDKVHEQNIEQGKLKVKNSKQKYDSALKKIQMACEQTGVQESSVVDFLGLTSQMLPNTLQMLERTATVNENMNLFYDIIRQKATTKLTIEDYFITQGLKTFIKPLKNASLQYLRDIKVSKDEFNEDILPILCSADGIKNNKLPIHQKNQLKQICCDPKTIKKWEKDEKLQKIQKRKTLLSEVPPLGTFFNIIHSRTKFAFEHLRMVKSSENEQIIMEAENSVKKLTLPKLKAIKLKNDSDSDDNKSGSDNDTDNDKNDTDNDKNSDSDSSDDEINIKQLNNKKLIKYIKNLSMKDEYIKKILKSIKNNNIKGKYLMKCENGKQIRKLLNKDINIKIADKLYNILNKNKNKTKIKIIKNSYLFSKFKNDRMKCLDDEYNDVYIKLPKDKQLLKKIKKANKQKKDIQILVESKKKNGKFLEKNICVGIKIEDNDSSDDSNDSSDNDKSKQNDSMSDDDSDSDSNKKKKNKPKKPKKVDSSDDDNESSDNISKKSSKKRNNKSDVDKDDDSSDNDNKYKTKSKKSKKKKYDSESDNDSDKIVKRKKNKNRKSKNDDSNDDSDGGSIKKLRKSKKNAKKYRYNDDNSENESDNIKVNKKKKKPKNKSNDDSSESDIEGKITKNGKTTKGRNVSDIDSDGNSTE